MTAEIRNIKEALLYIAENDNVREGQENLSHHLGISTGSLSGLLNGRKVFSEKLFHQCNDATLKKYDSLLIRFVGTKVADRKKDFVNGGKRTSANFKIAGDFEVEFDDTSDIEHIGRVLDMAFERASKHLNRPSVENEPGPSPDTS